MTTDHETEDCTRKGGPKNEETKTCTHEQANAALNDFKAFKNKLNKKKHKVDFFDNDGSDNDSAPQNFFTDEKPEHWMLLLNDKGQ